MLMIKLFKKVMLAQDRFSSCLLNYKQWALGLENIEIVCEGATLELFPTKTYSFLEL